MIKKKLFGGLMNIASSVRKVTAHLNDTPCWQNLFVRFFFIEILNNNQVKITIIKLNFTW